MMINYQDAIVTLKNGRKKYGKLLLSDTETGQANALRFFTNESFRKGEREEEILYLADILSIEIDLK